MFARVFDTAKRILSRSPSVQGRSEETLEETPRSTDLEHESEMVTTRRGTGTEPPAESTPRSSARRGRPKRQLDVEETPTASKRRRKSVEDKRPSQEEVEEKPDPAKGFGEEQEPEAENIDTIAVTIPDRTKEKAGTPEVVKQAPSTLRKSPRVVVQKKPPSSPPTESLPTEEDEGFAASTQEMIWVTPATKQSSSVYATPVTSKKVSKGTPTPKAKSSTPVSTRRSSRLNNNKTSQQPTSPPKEGNSIQSTFPDEIPSSTWETDQLPVAGEDVNSLQTSQQEKTHTRFDSEEPVETLDPIKIDQEEQGEAPVETSNTQKEAIAEDDDASDSDEAPEMVTTATAASKVKAAEAEASRAYQAQQEKEERRRQQRADRIAEEQAEKRKREEKKAKKLAKFQAKQEKLQQRLAAPAAPQDVDMSNVPALLPDSILEAAGDRRPPTPPPTRPGKTAEEIRKEKLNRHIKFLERGERPIKDVKKGSVNVSVLAQHNKLLAPKVNKATKNIREEWLKGRRDEKRGGKRGRMQIQKMERRPIGGGFLRGED